ncbi:ABC-three component system middle component 5, partial [Pseudomonas fluorescens]
MVIYHPGYDVNHCVYRILNILNSIDKHEIQKDALRLIDFYYLYPHLLKSVNLPRPLNRYNDIISNTPDPFEVTPNPRSLFYELSRIQDSAMLALQQKSIIKLTASTITLLSDSLPADLIKTFNNDSFSKSELF